MNTTRISVCISRQRSSGNASDIGCPTTSLPTRVVNSSLAKSTTNPDPRYLATAAMNGVLPGLDLPPDDVGRSCHLSGTAGMNALGVGCSVPSDETRRRSEFESVRAILLRMKL